MSEDLLQAVKTTLLPLVEAQGFRAVESRISDSFDNAFVTLQSSELLIRITRERGLIEVDFGPATEPGTWFDSDVVLERLGLSIDQSFLGSRADTVMRGVGAFMRTCGGQVRAMFDETNLEMTKRELRRLKEARAERLFGWKAPERPGGA